jgi:predicted TIM-barrel fold metal-dependent hydrolase
MPTRLRIDIHQHLWTESLVAELARRSDAPFARLQGASPVLHLAGEPPHRFELDDPGRRAAVVDDDGVDRALVALSSALGIESLPADEARPLLDAYHEGVAGLPDRFGAWGAVSLADPQAADVDSLLDRGFAGITLPAGVLASPAAFDRVSPLLERLAARGAPLFVHPGPAAGGADMPEWWSAMTSYVAEMNAAWHGFTEFGRSAHPTLRVVFAMLAGGGPLHVERLAARGGPAERALDRDVFFDASSYGMQAIDAVIRVVGVDQIVYGSDRPFADPTRCRLGEAVRELMLVSNPARLLINPSEVLA